MAGRATISFSQAGVQPPVYVVTSLSNPPWEPLEMNTEDQKTEAGRLVFTRRFDNVADGSYQYKIRIGEGHWVVDESKDTATDGSGNRNNVVHVEHVEEPPPVAYMKVTAPKKRQDSVQLDETSTQPESDSIPPVQPEPADTPSSANDAAAARNEESSPNQLPIVPLPFTVVEKVSDAPHEVYGDKSIESLHEDSAKRKADADPDVEIIQAQSPVATEGQELTSPSIPAVIVNKSDDKPSFGDDFGNSATSAQKVAHEKRLADATPDKVIVSPDVAPVGTPPKSPTVANLPDLEESQDKLGPLDDEPAPLFRHESMEEDPPPAEDLRTNSMDTIEEESAQSSTDHTESQVMTPEAEGSEDDEFGELENAPLLPHEASFSASANGEQLRDRSRPGSESHVKDFGIQNFGSSIQDPESALRFPHEAIDSDDGEPSQVPLLPHERGSLASSASNGSYTAEDEPVSESEPKFSYEAPIPVPVSEKDQDSFFASRTKLGSLPHVIPRSDEDDEDLNDPSLEAFPTDRESILARVASISSVLPEDEIRESDHIGSPGLSVLSNACSSVSLGPRSGSLKSVVEEDIDDGNAPELPSPVLLTSSASRNTTTETLSESKNDLSPAALSKRDPSEKPSQAGAFESSQSSNQESTKFSNDQGANANAADSGQSNGGMKDRSKGWGDIYHSVATPSTVLQPLTPPITPKKKDAQNQVAREKYADTKIRESEISSSPADSGKSTPTPSGPPETDDAEDRHSSPAGHKYPLADQSESWIKALASIVLGPIGRLLTTLFGGPKQASSTLLILGIAIAVYNYLYVFSESGSASTSSFGVLDMFR